MPKFMIVLYFLFTLITVIVTDNQNSLLIHRQNVTLTKEVKNERKSTKQPLRGASIGA